MTSWNPLAWLAIDPLDVVMTNLDHSIDTAREAQLFANPGERSGHAAWNFHGQVWWDADVQCWYESIWVRHQAVDLIQATTLQALMAIANDRYGWE